MLAPWMLYLDFDGVLNNDPFLRHQRNMVPANEQRLFDPENLAALDHLCRELPVASITITSTWRQGRTVAQLAQMLAAEGFSQAHLVSDVTPLADKRSAEIHAHVAAKSVRRYLVLDDMNLTPLVRPQLFRTSPALGLNMALTLEVLDALRA